MQKKCRNDVAAFLFVARRDALLQIKQEMAESHSSIRGSGFSRE
jgi:hypothetical protein